MVRTIHVLCMTELVLVSLLGLLSYSPDGRPLSSRDLDALVGGSDPEWCYFCLNCSYGTTGCHDDLGCKEAGVPCPTIKEQRLGYAPEAYNSVMGNGWCLVGQWNYLLCAYDYPCQCGEFGLEQFACAPLAGTRMTALERTDQMTCSYETTDGPGNEDCF